MVKSFIKAFSIVTTLLLLFGCASLGGGNIATNNPYAYGDAQVNMFSNKDLVGKEVLLGGMITTINSQGDYVRVELVRYDLNNNGYPLLREPLDNNRLIVDIYGVVRINGYSPGDYMTAVGIVKQAENVEVSGEKIRVITMDASDYSFWRDPRRDVYYDEPFFNSPALRFGYYQPYWGVGFGSYYPYYW